MPTLTLIENAGIFHLGEEDEDMSDVANHRSRVMFVGDTAPDYEATIRDENGDVADTTGWTVTGGSVRFVHRDTEAVVVGTGTMSIPSAGNFKYTFGANDTATPGLYTILVRIDTTGSSNFATLEDRRGLLVKPLPS